MRRFLLLGLAWVALHAAVVHAIPARLPFVPQDPPRPPVVAVLANTVWRGMLYDPNSRIVFKGDGTLTYGEVGGISPGTWRLEGSKLYFQINNYSEYETFILGDVIQGEGWNKAGQRCKPLLRRAYDETPDGPRPNVAPPGLK